MSKRELLYAAVWGAVVMALTCVPYAVVWFFEPRGQVFPLVLFNSDDHGVYFAWMRQAADGHLLFRNLFTTDPQLGVYVQPYFLLLGWVARLTQLAIPIAYHLGRVVCGIGTLVLAYRLGAFFTGSLFARRCIFWTTALSAGVGWLFWADQVKQTEPVDVWQPEAVTFPSLYTNGLFAAALVLMLGVVVCLLLAETRGWRWAVAAGVCGLLLGIIHSYDVIHLTLAWVGYLGVRWAAERRFPKEAVGYGLLTAAVAAPSVAYMAWLYKSDPVFQSRADTATWSHGFHQYLLGYGFLVPLAAYGAMLLLKRRDALPESAAWRGYLPVAWSVAGLAAAYLPFAFQRKMIMGEHFPLSILAGLAVAELADRASRAGQHQEGKRAGLARPWVLAAVMIAALAPSSLRYLVRDVKISRSGFTSTGIHPVYWPKPELDAFRWMHDHTPPRAVLLTFPFNGVMAPAHTGRTVYAGHWGETPRWNDRVREGLAFYSGRWSSEERLAFLRGRGITHVLWSDLDREYTRSLSRGTDPERPVSDEPFLKPVFQTEGATLYEVTSAPSQRSRYAPSAVPSTGAQRKAT